MYDVSTVRINILELLVSISLILTIAYKRMLILLFIMNLKMTVGRSKRRSFLTLTFLVKIIIARTTPKNVKHP